MLNSLAIALVDAGRAAEAAPLFQDYLKRRQTITKSDEPARAGDLAIVSLHLLRGSQFESAEPLLRECLEIRERAQPDAWTTFNTQSMLGGILLSQEKYVDAEPLLLKGYEGMQVREETIPAQGIVRVVESLDRLIELYTAIDKPDEAEKYQDLRAGYRAAKVAQP